MKKCILGLGLCVCTGFSGVVSAAPAENPQAEHLRTEAVELARGGSYEKSLQLLSGLEKQGYQGQGFWADYLTILSWAGKEPQMLAAAERHYQGHYEQLPDYAAMPLARAYLHQGKTQEGKALLQMLAGRGNREAGLSYAEQLLYEGNTAEAQKVYSSLSAGKVWPEYQLAYSRACAAMERNDFVEAEKQFALAKAQAPKDAIHFTRDADAKRAAMYIQRREEDRAVNILRPYVEQKKATMNMISDYLTALRFDNRQAEAIAGFKMYCPDWQQVPSYGLQNMADLYLRAERFPEADKIYTYILKREDIGYVRMGHAYCLALQGREEAAFQEYQEIVKRYPALQPAVAGDGTTFIGMGKLHLARQVYGLLGATPEEKAAYQLQYAQSLSGTNKDLGDEMANFRRDEALNERVYYHEAQKIYQNLAANRPELSSTAYAGIADNKVNKGLFADAGRILTSLNEKDANNIALFAANANYEQRQRNTLHTYFETSMDNKRNHNSELGLEFQRYLGANVYGISGMQHSWLQDENTRASYNFYTTGASWHFDRGQINLAYDEYRGGASVSGLTTGFTYEFNDLASLAFSTGKRPHAAAGAVQAGVDERFHTLRWEQILNERLRFGVNYEWDSLSDGNRYASYGGDVVYGLSNRRAYRDRLLFNYSHGHYDQTMDAYDSPGKRIDYAGGFSRKWGIPRHNRTWEWITMLGWGHDNEEDNDFSPMTRVEYTQFLPANQRLVLGTEFTWYQNRAADTEINRRKNGFLFDVNYYLEW